MPNGFMEGFQNGMAPAYAIQEHTDRLREQRRQEALRNAQGNFYGGIDPQAGEIARLGGDPRSALQDRDGQTKQMLQRAGQVATILANAPDENSRRNVFRQARSALEPVSQHLGLPLPPDWDESYLDEVQSIAQMFSEGGPVESWSNAGNGLMTSNRGNFKQIPGFEKRGPNLRPVMVPMADGSSRQMLFDPQSGQFSEPSYGGQPQSAADGPMMAADGTPVQFSDDVPADERQFILSNPQIFQDGAVIQGPPKFAGSGGMGVRPAKPPKAEADRTAPAGYRWKSDGNLEVIPGGPADRSSPTSGARAVKDPTEDQAKAAAWFNQAENAYRNLMAVYRADPSAADPGLIETYSPVDELANRSRTPNRQKYVQAASSLSEAFLRAATGAGITIDEAKQKFQELTPVRGDSPEVIKQKLAAIPVYLASLRNRAGRALPGGGPAPDKFAGFKVLD